MYIRNIKRLTFIFIIAFIIPSVNYACSEQIITDKTAAQLPVIEQFTGNTPSTACTSATPLKWNVTNATSVYIDHGIGKVASAGTRVVKASDNITYTLTATNEAGTASKSAKIYLCHNYEEPSLLPMLPGYEKYVDDVNGFGLLYPSWWIIDYQRFSDLNTQAGGVLSGVSFSNGKPGNEYSYYDVLIEATGPDFNKRAFADKYMEEQRAKGYTLVSDVTRQIATDLHGIDQTYYSVNNNLKFNHYVTFSMYNGKFWIITLEWPKDMDASNIPTSFCYLR